MCSWRCDDLSTSKCQVKFNMEVSISKTLPRSVLLGTNASELFLFLNEEKPVGEKTSYQVKLKDLLKE